MYPFLVLGSRVSWKESLWSLTGLFIPVDASMVAQTNPGYKFLEDALKDTYILPIPLGSKHLIYFFKEHE